jgi:predicted permease
LITTELIINQASAGWTTYGTFFGGEIMPLLPRLSNLWRNLFHRARKEQELTEEVDAYLEMLIEMKIEQGIDPAKARRAALIELGGKEQVKEKVRESRAGYQLGTIWQDLRYSLRMLRRNPGFASVAVLLLALGIGANTALFSVVDAALLKRLPVKAPEQLVLLSHTDRGRVRDTFWVEIYERIRDEDQTLSGLMAYYPLRLTVSVEGQAEPAISGQLVTGNYYAVLGVNALLGRTIAPEDDQEPGAHPVCVISEGYWRRRFGRDPGVIGKTIHLSSHPFTIIGVTPPDFFGAEIGSRMDITAPVTMREQVMPGTGRWNEFGNDQLNQFHVMGRLRPGATMESAQVSLGRLYQQYMADRYAWESGQWTAKYWDKSYMLKERLSVASGSQGLSTLRQQFSQSFFVLMLIVALTLLIACANVAGLLLARGVARRKEMAVRLALGAGRWRLVRQLGAESLLLAGLGGLLGLLLAWWGTRLMLPLLSQREIPLSLDLNPDLRMFGYLIAVVVLTGVLSGLVPALVATRVDLQSTLNQDAQRMSSRAGRLNFGRVFVIAQVALTMLLLVGAGLFVRSLQKLQQVDVGFSRENALVLKLEPTNSDAKLDYLPQLTALYDELLRRVKAIPGVEQASLVGYSPISRSEWLVTGEEPDHTNPLFVEDYTPLAGEEMKIHWTQVYANYFATLGIPFLAGRDFGPQDSWGAPHVAVINETMARRFFPGKNPVGRRFGLFSRENPGPIFEIIGVVKDVKYQSLREPDRLMFYWSFAQAASGRGQMTLVARTAGSTAPIAAAIQREAQALDPKMPRFTVETLAAQLEVSITQERLIATLSSVFGLLALALVCIGLYGVMAYDVARRTREIGIRMALGASARQIAQMALGETLWLVGIGMAIGLGAALAAMRLVKSLLFGLQPHDPLTIGVTVSLLLAVAAVAGYLPARRASNVDPMVALRHD